MCQSTSSPMFYVDGGLCGLIDMGLRWAEGLEQGRVRGRVGSRIFAGFFFSRLAVWARCHSTRSFSYWLCCQWVLVRVWSYCVHRTCWRMSGALVVRVGRLLARATNYKLVNLFHCCHKSGELLGRNVRFPVLPTSYGIVLSRCPYPPLRPSGRRGDIVATPVSRTCLDALSWLLRSSGECWYSRIRNTTRARGSLAFERSK